MSAIADLTCAELIEAYRRGDAVAGRGGARRACAHRGRTPRSMPSCRSSRSRVLAAAAASEARWRAGDAARRRSTACRPRSRTISGPRACRPGAARSTSDATPAARRCAGGRAAARAGRGHSRQDLHARTWLDRRLPQSAHRHHPQSVESASTRPAARPAAARSPRCWALACCISAPTGPARCAFRRPSPAFSA